MTPLTAAQGLPQFCALWSTWLCRKGVTTCPESAGWHQMGARMSGVGLKGTLTLQIRALLLPVGEKPSASPAEPSADLIPTQFSPTFLARPSG